ncbi:hypothetical protein MPH_10041 [Macrophomina phaseolina MS6]|uniref:Uncharacterized protein n=2 Tax=Macrophomina phaseolina TaxID=35725 RepID=K2RDY3_MACPH|nr:hypothetical protein MPH_10041 [Macrophomina phaseolina MS6]KAH7018711.1 P-loop containing nucleoside triphosphate hydrolase protein [Macrophomina phaseolina]
MVATRASRQPSMAASLVHLPSSAQAVERDESVVETESRVIKMEPPPSQLSQADPTSRSTTAIPDNRAIEILGRGVKELVQAINKIEQLGITKVAGDTPKVVVVGDQSTGKSSVINAISGIQVPRSSGTCTRCPMQITLTENKEPNARWRCKISLRREFNYVSQRVELPMGQKVPHFYPWDESETPETVRFKTVSNKKDLQHAIYQAQLATLSPGADPATFVNMDEIPIGSGPFEVQFSPNLVCLDISAPDLPNLSFYDLPGVISQTENGGDPHIIKLVKQLVKRYVAKDNALVLLACSMENDIQNSSAAGLLRKYGAIDRCLGILTKPDRLPRGDPVDRWESILRCDAFQLGHGYHVVRNPSQAELDSGMDHSAARRMEANYFRGIKPWCDRFLEFSDRFGTEKLQDKLSQMLAIQILQSLPKIHDRVQQQLSRIDAELMHLPEPPTTNAQRIVLDAINDFATKVAKQMTGDYPENQFRRVWKALRHTFRESIANQRPTMLVKTARDVEEIRKVRASPAIPQTHGGSFMSQKQVIALDDSDEERAASAQPPPAKKRKAAPSDTPSSRRTQSTEHTTRFDLEDDIKKTLNEHTTSDIPGEIDPQALNHLRKETMRNWGVPTKVFLDGLNVALRNTLNQAVDDTLRAWKTTELSRETSRVSLSFLSVAFRQQQDIVVPRALKLERHKPMTENAAALEMNEKKELEIFQHARIQARTNLYFDDLDATTGKQTSRTERQKKANDFNFRSQLGPDPYSREVEAMSKIRGYYHVASMRYVDVVVMGIQAELMETLKEDLRDELITVLGVTGENSQEVCARLLAEDPAREMRRRALRTEKDKLVEALKCLQDLDEKYQRGTHSVSPPANGSLPAKAGTVQNAALEDEMEVTEA